MKYSKVKNVQRWRRKNRVRKKLRGTAERPRLSVNRSNKHLYCQVIDDESGKTLASASTRDKDLRDQITNCGNCDAAKVIGSAIADRAKAAGVTSVKLDRGRFKYHGRVAELADAAREGGLEL
ncbi:MAG: 50S ribosomal protein L18 [Pirellulaceae bacterium]|jgi:large subunit ribosomal protein L18|nr:50S ribosomal protein L18 [Pirellulaceae bacterium]